MDDRTRHGRHSTPIRFARVPIFPSPRHGDSREIGWRRETRAACSIVRSIDVWNAIDRLAIERIAIRHGDRDRDNARLTSLVPITHEAISHGISPDRIGSIDPPWKFRGDETLCPFALRVTRRNCGRDCRVQQWAHCAGDDRGMPRTFERFLELDGFDRIGWGYSDRGRIVVTMSILLWRQRRASQVRAEAVLSLTGKIIRLWMSIYRGEENKSFESKSLFFQEGRILGKLLYDRSLSEWRWIKVSRLKVFRGSLEGEKKEWIVLEFSKESVI